jgi:hypothetical protein
MSAQLRLWMVVLAGLLSIISAILASSILKTWNIQPTALRLAIALLPIPFFILYVIAELRWIRDQDEFHRRVFLDSLAIAFPLVIAEAVVIDALQKAGFLADLTVGTSWPFMALTWFPALWIAMRRYR